jgi:hypothetical protein
MRARRLKAGCKSSQRIGAVAVASQAEYSFDISISIEPFKWAVSNKPQ